MKYEIDTIYGVLKNDKLLPILEESRVLRIEPFSAEDGGGFCIEEMCDEYFGVRLTREQLIELGQEIIDLANKSIL